MRINGRQVRICHTKRKAGKESQRKEDWQKESQRKEGWQKESQRKEGWQKTGKAAGKERQEKEGQYAEKRT